MTVVIITVEQQI